MASRAKPIAGRWLLKFYLMELPFSSEVLVRYSYKDRMLVLILISAITEIPLFLCLSKNGWVWHLKNIWFISFPSPHLHSAFPCIYWHRSRMPQQMRLTSDQNLLLPQEEVVIKKEKATTTAEHSKSRRTKGCTNYKTTSP